MTGRELAERWPTMAAREKDAAVAEVKGWTRLRHRGWVGLRGLPPDGSALYVSVPYFANTWADAGPLLEELREVDGGYVELIATDAGWTVECRDHRAEAERAPEAIALAYGLEKLSS